MKFLKNLLAALLGCFIALGLLFLLAVGMIGALMPAEETVTVAPSSILRIELSSTIGEQTVSDPLDLSSVLPVSTGASSIGILDAVRAIDYAATDPAIKFIYLTDCGYSSGISYMEELRGALERFRASGKPVIAYGDNFSFGGYYLASVADKIYADEFASNNILGIATTIIFLKDVLDRFGVEMQLIRHGKYKSAGEQFIASDISEANREQNQAMSASPVRFPSPTWTAWSTIWSSTPPRTWWTPAWWTSSARSTAWRRISAPSPEPRSSRT